MSQEQHKTSAEQVRIRAAVLTVSDTRTEADDTGGKLACELLGPACQVISYQGVVKDEAQLIDSAIRSVLGEADVIVTTGGTGLSARDVTHEAIRSIVDSEIVGFGELFRVLSFEQIGPAAMLSRALAGTIGRTAIFGLPGSPKAVELALTKLIIPEMAHIVWELQRL